MGLVVSDSKKPMDPCPEGLTQAVCVDAVELGLCDTAWGKKEKIKLIWCTDLINDKTGKPFMVTKRYTASLNDKAILCQDLETWRGRKFTKEEKQSFDLEKLLGSNCQLQVVHNLADSGDVFANVQAIVPIGKGMTKMRIPEGYVRVKDREQNGHTGNGGSHDDGNQAGF